MLLRSRIRFGRNLFGNPIRLREVRNGDGCDGFGTTELSWLRRKSSFELKKKERIAVSDTQIAFVYQYTNVYAVWQDVDRDSELSTTVVVGSRI